MVQREWVEKDFYKTLGVSSDATDDEIKRVAKKLLAENHPDRNPDNPAAEERYKEVGEARDVLTDKAKRKEYDETRRMFAGGGFGRRFGGGGGGGGGGTPKLATEARVTGYVTAIDYVNHTITIGASYYGFGLLKVDANTKISFDNVNCTFEELAVGDWVEARYDYTTRTATKLSASGVQS